MSDQTLEIEALPTKDLFISMLTKDLGLKDAIGDLVDNSVDGARRIRGNGKYDGLFIKIEATKDYFKIGDNCGGISAELAREYVFRFGRPSNMPTIKHSVGQFGIGMKRALFKLGKNFKVESISSNSRFVVEVNVDKWKELEEWKFQFKELKKHKENSEDIQGTSITVTDLHADVIKQFELENFIIELKEELKLEQLYNIDKGLAIIVNGDSLDAPHLKLLQSDDFKTAYWKKTLDGMQVRIYTGISEPDLDTGGWYIFCNERLILGPEQSEITGWGAKRPVSIPKYHGQFNRFRGYVFFDADDASLLPLNTTKTNMDVDSLKLQAVRQRMVRLMRPVIDFLNKLHDEGVQYKRQEIDDNPLERAVENADLVNLSDINTTTDKFEGPTPPDKDTAQPRTRTIQYSKPLDEIEDAKEALGAQTLKEVGEKTFEYFMEMEVNE